MIVKKVKTWIYDKLFGSKLQKYVQVFDNPKVNSYFEKNSTIKRDVEFKFDDYNWDLYNEHYRSELEEISKEHGIKLVSGDYELKNNVLTKNNPYILNLHPNWHVLYETILQLKPASVVEVGCGSAMHLHNLQILNNTFELTGFDRSEEQLKFSGEIFPEFNGELVLNDITKALKQEEVARYEVCYTQAVIMHLRTQNNHIKALKNLFALASNQVVLMENWVKHPFKEIIDDLFAKGEIQWPNLYYYYKPEPTTKKPHLMICSSIELDYPKLSDYSILLNS